MGKDDKDDFCVFNVDRRTMCSFPLKWPFTFFICPNHLKMVYGLDLYYLQLDGETHSMVQGPYLIPALGCPFRANTVVFPTREFIDTVFDPRESEMQADHFTYQMNPSIKRFVRDLNQIAMRNKGNDTVVYNCRYQYEVLRNLFVDSKGVNIGQSNYRDQFIGFKNDLQTKLMKVEAFVENNPVYEARFGKLQVKGKNNGNAFADLNEAVPSRPLKVLLANCMYDQHRVPTDKNATLSVVPVNFTNHPNIGWTTLERIVNPVMLCVEGNETGCLPWYQHTTTIIDKDVRHRNMTVGDMPNITGVHNALRGAGNMCR